MPAGAADLLLLSGGHDALLDDCRRACCEEGREARHCVLRTAEVEEMSAAAVGVAEARWVARVRVVLNMAVRSHQRVWRLLDGYGLHGVHLLQFGGSDSGPD